MTRSGFYAGTFDPFTIGHQSVVDRALELFDRVVIGIGLNAQKSPFETAQQRLERIRAVYAHEPRVSVVTYDGLTADAARAEGCTHLLRGVRTAMDFEYERAMADANRRISGLETVLLYTLPELSYVSSSLVRDLASHHHDIQQFLPKQQ
jgi:pantetheine-phosphate adenylyltransferase